ncbi:Protein CBR-STR-94 [Caenorhabditis briggsae]|uniref:Serpentine receptor class r-10 n=1 Tax=Caenorhabditis briggsae TaxID=6238 RepID=A8XV56_CAEBR|nr:Protein CBR-STR-94 [Caenorhabditis briggsae]CAP36523.2 Protein CBR-STR-94 [Caenorhabditis briggsae]
MQIPFVTYFAEYLGFFIAFFANLTLIHLILTRTKNNFGSYKYLMLWFACFSLWYSIIDILTQPAMHSYLNSYIVFCASWFKYDPVLAPIIITSYCTSYGLTLVLLAIHFIYRYIAMIRPNQIHWFKYPHALIWPIIFSVVAVFWWCNVYFLLSSNPTFDAYLNETIYENYEERIERLSYIGPLYFIVGEQGDIQIQWKSCLGMINVYCIITTLVTIMCLGYSVYKKMQSVNDLVAEKTRALQKQLFHALVLQTIVPIIFMYSPTTVLFICPIIGVELGVIANMTSICLALYPALDPLVVMYFIRDYRTYLMKKLNLTRSVSTTTRNTSITKHDTGII